MWLRHYLKLHVLAYLFKISKSTVAEEIFHIVPIIFLNYRYYISWHNLRKWQDFLDRYPNVVGMVDDTLHTDLAKIHVYNARARLLFPRIVPLIKDLYSFHANGEKAFSISTIVN